MDNDLQRLSSQDKTFFRWLYNEYEKHEEEENTIPMELWKNPHFINMLKPKKTKLLSPYYERDIWVEMTFKP